MVCLRKFNFVTLNKLIQQIFIGYFPDAMAPKENKNTIPVLEEVSNTV